MGRTTNTLQGTNRRGRSADTRQASSTLFHNFLYSKVKTPTKELHCECMTKAAPTKVRQQQRARRDTRGWGELLPVSRRS
jgi:hypothetical protein